MRSAARSDSGSGVVAYLRHADSRGVSSPGTLRCAPRTGLWQGAVAPRRCVRMYAEMRYNGSEAVVSVEDEVRRADPLSVNPGQRPGREDEEICTARRCRCRCIAGVCRRRRSAAHVRRCVYPRRCRGLTESVTARAVGVRRLYSGIVGWLCWRVAERRHFSVTPYA